MRGGGKFVAMAMFGMAAASFSAAAFAQSNAPDGSGCVFMRDWRGWKAPSEDAIYIHVGVNRYYRIDLSTSSPKLMWPEARLHFNDLGIDIVCSAQDLDITLNDLNGGFREKLTAKSITRLTPEEVAAIPVKLRP
jgi:hypothetical protein